MGRAAMMRIGFLQPRSIRARRRAIPPWWWGMRCMGRWSKARHSIVIAAAVLLIGIPASFGVAALLARQIDATARSQFSRVAEQVGAEFYAWTFRPIYGTNGLRGAYAASETVTDAEFRDYYLSRDLPVEFPGMQNIGFATPDALDDAGGWTIRHMEPRERYGRMMGEDLAPSADMRRSFERAIETNTSVMLSARGMLSADPTMHVWIVPVYRNGMPREDANDRRTAIEGVIFAHFRIEDLASRLEIELDGMAELTISKFAGGDLDVWLDLV